MEEWIIKEDMEMGMSMIFSIGVQIRMVNQFKVLCKRKYRGQNQILVQQINIHYLLKQEIHQEDNSMSNKNHQLNKDPL